MTGTHDIAPILRVALATPLRRLFDYRSPAGPAQIDPGTRVRVPFGRRQLIGVVMQIASRSEIPGSKLKPVVEALDKHPVFDGALLELMTWAAGYYHHPIGEVIGAALPKSLRLGASLRAMEERWHLTESGEAACASDEPRRAPRQRRLLVTLAEGPATAATLEDRLGSWRDAARALRARGWIASTPVPPAGEPAGVPLPRTAHPGPALNEEQQQATQRICQSIDAFGAFVLHGVTGSGKTEVYLRVTESALAQGRSALVLVPEIGLTPQLLGRFRERFGVGMAVLHSALTDPERLAAWR